MTRDAIHSSSIEWRVKQIVPHPIIPFFPLFLTPISASFSYVLSLSLSLILPIVICVGEIVVNSSLRKRSIFHKYNIVIILKYYQMLSVVLLYLWCQGQIHQRPHLYSESACSDQSQSTFLTSVSTCNGARSQESILSMVKWKMTSRIKSALISRPTTVTYFFMT